MVAAATAGEACNTNFALTSFMLGEREKIISAEGIVTDGQALIKEEKEPCIKIVKLPFCQPRRGGLQRSMW